MRRKINMKEKLMRIFTLLIIILLNGIALRGQNYGEQSKHINVKTGDIVNSTVLIGNDCIMVDVSYMNPYFVIDNIINMIKNSYLSQDQKNHYIKELQGYGDKLKSYGNKLYSNQCEEYKQCVKNAFELVNNIYGELLNCKDKFITDTQADVYNYIKDFICHSDQFSLSMIDSEIVIRRKIPLQISSETARIYPFVNGYAKFKINDKFGCIDMKHDIIVQPHFDSIQSINTKYILARTASSYYIINTNTKEEKNLSNYDEIVGVGEKWIMVQKDGKYNYIDLNGNYFNKEDNYLKATPFSSGKAIVQNYEGSFIVNEKGRSLKKLSILQSSPIIMNSSGICMYNNVLHDTTFCNVISKSHIFWEKCFNDYFVCSDYRKSKYNNQKFITQFSKKIESPFLNNYNDDELISLCKEKKIRMKGASLAIINPNGTLIYNTTDLLFIKDVYNNFFIIAKPFVQKKTGSKLMFKYGLINKNGMKCFDCDYDDIQIVNDQKIIAVKNNNKDEYYVDDLGNKHLVTVKD